MCQPENGKMNGIRIWTVFVYLTLQANCPVAKLISSVQIAEEYFLSKFTRESYAVIVHWRQSPFWQNRHNCGWRHHRPRFIWILNFRDWTLIMSKRTIWLEKTARRLGQNMSRRGHTNVCTKLLTSQSSDPWSKLHNHTSINKFAREFV
jgi:hypothetical protein